MRIAVNGRMRVIRAIEFDCPARIPIMHAFLPAATAKLGENAVKDISDKYPHDFADVYQYSTMPADPLYQKRIHRDDWGCFCVNTNPQRSESWNAGSEPTTSNMRDSCYSERA